ncbi:MAG TPA: hypothetical protein VE967_07835 [Gemmatimonadaceae bacterium]|nr:hypothetical protein [Gemmatimonadaceae bacterium]
MKSVIFVLTAGLVLAGCRGDRNVAQAATVDSTAVDTISGPHFVPIKPVVSKVRLIAAQKRIPLTVSFAGAGPFHPGMSLAQAVVATEGDFWTSDKSIACSYFRSNRTPGVKYLFLNRRLARIEVDSGATTEAGVGIGATEDQVESAYSGRTSLTKDTFTDGYFLTASAPDDSLRKIVFELHNRRVTRYRTGIVPAIGWVEGCS